MSKQRNIIPYFTKREIDYILENANFTRDERALFVMRNNEHSLEECAEMINVSTSTISKIHKRVLTKIYKVIEIF